MPKRGELTFTWVTCCYLSVLMTNSTGLMAAAYQGVALPYNTIYGTYTIVPTEQAYLWGMGYRSESFVSIDQSPSSPTASIERLHEDTDTASPSVKPAANPVNVTSTIPGGTLYFISESNFLYVLSPSGGEPHAIVVLPGSKYRSFVPNGTLYARWNESFYEINPAQGTSVHTEEEDQQLQALIPADGGFYGLYGFAGEPPYSISLLTGILPLSEIPDDPEPKAWKPFLEWWLEQVFPPKRANYLQRQ